MFQDTFAGELATRLGSRVEVATDSNLIEGVLATVTSELILVIDVMSGYGQNNKIYLSLDAVNYITFTSAAA
ncbi:hypothetical protein SAMN05421676_102141 [Salinibacillus kushneri]|uniref:DUF2642 domain-containing protein n=1 Tax=Salinibacillus kushneri TaxID=237682 RepID=A0A1I0AIJ6_9BACI|nr:hypothetical protein [Salinibacillus kushneri]SES93081.1 hypothetical protein SAMN05421676_102141 [Salinibacillus kushneri]